LIASFPAAPAPPSMPASDGAAALSPELLADCTTKAEGTSKSGVATR
jgi:hypothetical protein